MIMWTTQDGEQHHRTDDASRIQLKGLPRAGRGPVSVQVGRGEAHEIDWAVLSPYLCVFPNLPHCLPDKVPPPWEHTHCCPLPLFWKWNLPVYLDGSGRALGAQILLKITKAGSGQSEFRRTQLTMVSTAVAYMSAGTSEDQSSDPDYTTTNSLRPTQSFRPQFLVLSPDSLTYKG